MAPPLNLGNRGHGSWNTARARSEDSWVEISSQPSSSSLSSAADEIVTTGLRVQQQPASQRRRRQRQAVPSRLNVASQADSVGASSSQEEYEESESDDEHAMTWSGEGLTLPATHTYSRRPVALDEDDDDENRTAVNYPINNDIAFTPQPNAFTHPQSSHSARHASQPVPGSYFPAMPERRQSARHSYPSRNEARVQHSPFNMTSPSYNAAADHEAALRASLSTLQSFAAAARGLPKPSSRTPATDAARPTSNRIQPNTLRMVPASALEGAVSPPAPAIAEPTFNPTIRRASTSTSASAEASVKSDSKRKGASGRGSSKQRRAIKKRRGIASYTTEDVSPTLFTWVVSVGVVVVFSAISFSAGYSMGKEAGRFEAGMTGGSEASACAREAGKSGLGLRRLRLGAVASGVGVGA